MKDIFKDLSSININDKVEKKGQHKYLSWAHAWTLAKQKFPEIQRIVYECDSTGLNYFTDGNSAYVKVGITIEGLEHIDYLPIMDFRNNSVPIDKVTSTDVNKTIQRSTAKAIAMHGLGLTLWTGEDVPEMVTTKTKKPSKPALIELKINDDNWSKVMNYVAENKDLGLPKIVEQLSRKYNVTSTIKSGISKAIKTK